MIRLLTPDDAEELAALYVANRDFLAPYNPVQPEVFFTPAGQRERLVTANGVERWRFAILDGSEIAGTVSITDVVRGARQSGNIGYWVAEPSNGRGLATSAVGQVVEFGFDEAGLHRLEAGTLLGNLRSQRVLEKNGFERYGIARRFLKIAGEWQDHVLFERIAR